MSLPTRQPLSSMTSPDGDPDDAPASERVGALLRLLRQAVIAGCGALTQFDLAAVAAGTERQQVLCASLRRVLLDGKARTLIKNHMDELRELKALTAVQRALVDGGGKAIQLEINLARMAQLEAVPESASFGMGE